MPHLPKLISLATLTMIAFAGNSLLCRFALDQSGMDPASFTSIRLISGAASLWLLVKMRASLAPGKGNWLSAFALFAYAAGFSFAYVNLTAATGALLLFGAVQTTMISHGIYQGERLRAQQWIGLALALVGIAILLWPGLSAPPLRASILMLASGIAWSVYSLRGRNAGDPTRITAGNFIKSIPFAIALSLLMIERADLYNPGIWAAIASGTVASGLSYTVWYTVLPKLKATQAATIQLSVPLFAAFGGLFLGELISLRLIIASIAILCGIALVIIEKKKRQIHAELSQDPNKNKQAIL
jgi:drug/metabolite transporter (DMT)-like permease